MEYLHKMQLEFKSLEDEEKKVDAGLDDLIKQQPNLLIKAKQLKKLNIDDLHHDTKTLATMVELTSKLADQISGKVRLLDLAKNRVFEAIQRVDDVLDLKFCSDGVEKSMKENDLETAAAHIHRYMCLDENLLRQSVYDERLSINASLDTLEKARKKLADLVDEQFAAAARSGDDKKVEKYMRLFPLLKQSEKGLNKYGQFLQMKIKQKGLDAVEQARERKISFADAATVIFESIAALIDSSQPFIETYYGPGILFTMVKQLQQECDRQAINVLQSFDMERLFMQTGEKILRCRRGEVDPLTLDGILNEISRLSERSEMYFRFLRRRLKTDLECTVAKNNLPIESKELDNWISNTKLSHQLQEIMDIYVSMEKYYMRESIQKAIEMDTLPEGSLSSSMIDDIFYVLKKSRDRAVASGNLNCVCAVINQITSILECDFIETLRNNLRTFPGSGLLDNLSSGISAFGAMAGTGKIVSAEDKTEQQRKEFLTSLNNAEMASDYINDLAAGEIARRLGRILSPNEEKNIENCIFELSLLGNKFKQLVDSGLNELNNSLLKPEVKPCISEFQDVSHDVNDFEFAEAEANEPWIQGVLINLHNLLNNFKPQLSSASFDHLVSYLTNTVAATLERAVLKTRFTRLGGLQFDRELRSLVNFLTSVTSNTVRDRFARLHQINTVLNLEEPSEVLEYYSKCNTGITWRLTPSEVRQVLNLRTEFKFEEIKRLNL